MAGRRKVITPEAAMADKVRAWRDGAAGFFQWLDDVQPRILSHKGGYQVFKLADFQRRELEQALERKEDGTWRYGTICLCWPRRHSKTVCAALLALWRFTCWQTQRICLTANSRDQAGATAWRTAKNIALNTPALMAMIGGDNITQDRMVYPALSNVLEIVGYSARAAYGQRLSIGWVSELHAAADDSMLQVLASSLGDSLDGWLLIDSTTDGPGGPLDRLETLATTGEDPTIFFSKISYQNLEEALERSPEWIRREWLRSRAKQMLPGDFASQHLNLRGSGSNALFKAGDVAACRAEYTPPVNASELTALVEGRKYVVGGGLDRAYGFSLHGDATIWTSVAKTSRPDGEPEIYVLNQEAIPFSQGRGIKKAIGRDHDRFGGFGNVILESYNSQDISAWCADTKIPHETQHAHQVAQRSIFTELHRLVSEHRLFWPAGAPWADALEHELLRFTCRVVSGKAPKFEAAKGAKDDRVFSLAWAVWSLRESELATYELKTLVCSSRSPHQRLCYLRTGSLILPCSDGCEAHKRVEMMHLQHLRRRVDRELTLPEFFKTLVKVAGGTVYQGR